MHDLAGLTNLKSASGLGISGYSATRKMRKSERVGGLGDRGREKVWEREKGREKRACVMERGRGGDGERETVMRWKLMLFGCIVFATV